jgi:hypothetical protein
MKFYRYDESVFDERPKIIESTFSLVKETPCGYWIKKDNENWRELFSTFSSKQRWVSKTARKRFAYPTKEQALLSFIARKRRQIAITEWQLLTAESYLELATEKAREEGYTVNFQHHEKDRLRL